MEKAFHAKWWDYSNQRFNIKGRICLASSLLFGGGVAILIKFIQPAVMSVTDRIPFTARAVAAFVIYSILIIDVAFTIQSLKDIVKSLKEIQNFAVENAQQRIDKTDEILDGFVEKVKSIPSPEEQWEKLKTNDHIEDLLAKMTGEKAQFYKLKNIFPKMQFKNYKEAVDFITSRFKKK
jgi:uncharacterized membrane protein